MAFSTLFNLYNMNHGREKYVPEEFTCMSCRPEQITLPGFISPELISLAALHNSQKNR